MRARFAPVIAACVALAGCQDFNTQMGSEVDNGTFGSATRANLAVQTGETDLRVALGQRFAAEVPATITFPFNSASLTPGAAAALDHQANWMRQFPELRFSVYGHTDLVGSASYNKALGLRRARAVVAYLGSRGISASRLDALVSYGETHPLIPVATPEQQNRRTVTEVAGFVGRNATPLNGKYAAVIWREYMVLGEREHPKNRPVQNELQPGG